jgi:glycosyltransferase involved in cell wall biosynthesis
VATIDVLLPVRDALPFLGEAIDSIRNQTFSDWRLLILDDGSQDGSLELAQKYEEGDARIAVFSFPKADGLAALLNAGLEKCDCRYMLRQDADDISLPHRMSVVNESFDRKPDLFVVGGDLITIDSSGRQIEYVHLPGNPISITVAGFFYNPMRHPTIAANFAALRRHDAVYGKDILNSVPEAESMTVKHLAEDYFLFGQLALIGPCMNVNVPLVKYRKHGGSIGVLNAVPQTKLALQISRFLAKSFCAIKGLPEFDPAPFCNHADCVFDFRRRDYTREFERMAVALRLGLGPSSELDRELAFRWVLATRNSGLMAARLLQFHLEHGATAREWLTVRNWLLRGVRKGKYVYRLKARATTDDTLNGHLDQFE